MKYVVFIKIKGFRASPCIDFPGREEGCEPAGLCEEGKCPGPRVNKAPPKKIPPEICSCMIDGDGSRRAITAR